MKKATPVIHDQLVYVVQDYDQKLCGVYTSLQLAEERFKHVVDEGLTKEEIDALIEEFGEDYRETFERTPSIVVYQLNTGWIWSYDSLLEITHALNSGEQYE